MFDWKIKDEIIAANAIILGEQTEEKGRPFKARFLQAGLVKYNFGVCLLKKETIDKFINTFMQCPVIVGHKDNIKMDDVVGHIENIWFSPEDGWFWCSGHVDEETAKKVDNGYNVSCQYRITEYTNNDDNKLHNGNPYDKEILNGIFEHLAVVKNPRYEDAYIAVNAIMATNEDQWITIEAEKGQKDRFQLIEEEKKEKTDIGPKDEIKQEEKEPKTVFNSFIEQFKDMLYETVAEGIYNRLGELIALNEDKQEPKDWITVKGNHIPVFGEPQEAAEKFIEEKTTLTQNMSAEDIEESRKQVNNLERREKESIKIYTDDLAFSPINKYLRNEIGEKDIKPEHKQAIGYIDKALKKCSLPNDTILYRGVRSDFIEKVFGEKEIAELIGDVFDEEPTKEDILKVQAALLKRPFQDTGFTSTSYAREKAFDHQPLMLEINVPKNTNAAAVDKLSKLREKEGEILINKDYNYVIKKIGLKKNKDSKIQWNFIVDLVL